ncbi:16101_t:CDS:10 [Entrophospora sp. SA101]|nr:15330_t:CDS:10 [Entrophospora sp. SA101]CAJ0631121.1 16101_t:CDS:10 [Entrophospora sp. SA101]CAJ0914966.1 7406_t:CDS:10 [Entrophospora sp. SA101]
MDNSDTIQIQPDHFYDGKGGVPVFKPTFEQFKDFGAFVASVRKYGTEYGIIKVIPPSEWKSKLPNDLSEKLAKIKIAHPIQQVFMRQSKCGAYIVKNVETHKTYSVEEWAKLCEQEEHRPPETRYLNPRIPLNNNQKVVQKQKPSSSSANNNNSLNFGSLIDSQQKFENITDTTSKSEQKRNETISESSNHLITSENIQLFTPNDSPNNLSVDYSINNKLLMNNYISTLDSEDDDGDESEMEVLCTSGIIFEPKVVVEPIANIDNPPKFNYHSVNGNLPYNDEQYIKELERDYWRNLPYSPPYYGADMAASFAWHVEDKDLYSINYIHFGAPKQWYSISPLKASNFELNMKGWFPHAEKECLQFLRHKEYMVSPTIIGEVPIAINRLIQREGEFVITFPRGYHSGYNLGFNCAESVNFAFEDWIDYGIKAKSCTCRPDSVQIDVELLFGHLINKPPEQQTLVMIERPISSILESSSPSSSLPYRMPSSINPKKMLRLKTSKEISFSNQHKRPKIQVHTIKSSPNINSLNSLSSSTNNKLLSPSFDAISHRMVTSPITLQTQISSRTLIEKHKYILHKFDKFEIHQSSNKTVKSREIQSKHVNSTRISKQPIVEHKLVVKNKKPHRYEPYTIEKNNSSSITLENHDKCFLCPVRGKETIRTVDGRYAHRLCASFIPETFAVTQEEFGEEFIVVDMTYIPLERKSLICHICKTSDGVCIQCRQCTTAFHVFCAYEAGDIEKLTEICLSEQV